MDHTTAVKGKKMEVPDKKPKINWPKASEAEKYRQFDDTMSVVVANLRGNPEWKLNRMAEILYEEGKERFGLEGDGKTERKKGGPSRRDSKTTKLRAEKKKLRTRWLQADEQEKDGLKVLYEELKARHRRVVRDQRRLDRRREVRKARKDFISDPYKFAKGLFTESKSGKLECTKQELESHLAQTYNDPRREEELPPFPGLKKPTRPGIAFNMADLKKKEVDDFIKKARTKSCPGNDGISYKVYKRCDKLRKHLFLLLRQMWRKKKVAERWHMSEGLYLPKEADAKKIGDFRPISILNVDGKVFFGILAWRVISFVQQNGYVDESVQKAGVPGIPGCVEHAYAIWDAIQKAKKDKEDLDVVWLDLANAYGSVPHKLLKMAMEHFWFPEAVQDLLMSYYDNFVMRFSTGKFTTEWQRLEVGIAAGCTISVVLFVLVMEMILKSTDTDGLVIKTPLRAFMDDITVLSKVGTETKRVLERLDQLISWSRMKFKAKKSRTCSLRKGNPREVRFKIAGDPIPTVKEEPVKSLGRWYKGRLSDRSRGKEVYDQAVEGLKSIDHSKLPGKFKLWCLQFGLYPRLLWPLMVYEIAESRVEMIEKKCRAYTRKWLGLPKCLNNAALYGKGIPLELPITSIVEEYKAGKVRTVMMLRLSKDSTIRENPPEVKTGKRWSAEQEADRAEAELMHRDIVGAVQSGRQGVGINHFTPFCMSSDKEKRDAVVATVRGHEQESNRLHLVRCPQQGQCLSWQELVVDRKLSWKELWKWEPARTSFLIRSTYDVLPSVANLVRWGITEDDKCKCGQYGSLRHTLSSCSLGLQGGRYTWRHDQVLRVISEALEEKIDKVNAGKVPQREVLEGVKFHQQGVACPNGGGGSGRVRRNDVRWEGKWKIATDLDELLVFPIVATSKRPDIVIWSEERKIVHLLELTVPWESNLELAEERKEARYEDLLQQCEEQGWTASHSHLGVGARGYVDKKLLQLFRMEMGFSSTEIKQLRERVQEAAEKASLFIWLKRDDSTWLENNSKIA